MSEIIVDNIEAITDVIDDGNAKMLITKIQKSNFYGTATMNRFCLDG